MHIIPSVATGIKTKRFWPKTAYVLVVQTTGHDVRKMSRHLAYRILTNNRCPPKNANCSTNHIPSVTASQGISSMAMSERWSTTNCADIRQCPCTPRQEAHPDIQFMRDSEQIDSIGHYRIAAENVEQCRESKFHAPYVSDFHRER